MDPVFDAQYRSMKDAFSREGIEIDVAYTPAGEPDYMYQVGRLLAVDIDDTFERLEAILPGLRRTDSDAEPVRGDLMELSIEHVTAGDLTVPEALDLIDESLEGNPALTEGGEPLATPVHIVHIARLCPPWEPEVPGGHPTQPWPAPHPAGKGHHGVRLGVCDTGLLKPLDPAQYPWLAGVDGDTDPLGPALPNDLRRIPQFAGHGTFAAGVARCMAPGTTVYVGNHFTKSGGEREHVLIRKLGQLIRRQSPDVVNLSAGTYTRRNWASIAFSHFRRRHPEVTLVAAAGNDSRDRPFYPAASAWTVAVGALGADQKHRAWFSNYGDWVNVYALGEGLVNAYATGEYTYQEPPKRPAKQTFDGMARWDGTSFSAPLVAGLIAAEMARTGAPAPDALQAVLALAEAQEISGVGPVLYPRDVV